MSEKVNYTLVGLFVVIFMFVSVLLFFWMHYKSGRTVYDTYVLYIHDDVTGLAVQSPVRYTGVPVGYVQSIELDKNNPQLVKIFLQIKQDAPILTSTVATLSVQGITGSAYVALDAKTDNAPKLKTKPGEQYPIIQSKPSLLNKITNALPEVADNVQTLTQSINEVLSKSNQAALSQILVNVENFTSTLSSTSPDINKILNSLNTTMANAEKSSKQLPELINKTTQTMKDINQTVNEIQKASVSFKNVLGSAQLLISNTTQQLLPTTSTLVVRLNSLSLSLQQFANELNRNPSVLIRGRQQSLPGPGETR